MRRARAPRAPPDSYALPSQPSPRPRLLSLGLASSFFSLRLSTLLSVGNRRTVALTDCRTVGYRAKVGVACMRVPRCLFTFTARRFRWSVVHPSPSFPPHPHHRQCAAVDFAPFLLFSSSSPPLSLAPRHRPYIYLPSAALPSSAPISPSPRHHGHLSQRTGSTKTGASTPGQPSPSCSWPAFLCFLLFFPLPLLITASRGQSPRNGNATNYGQPRQTASHHRLLFLPLIVSFSVPVIVHGSDCV